MFLISYVSVLRMIFKEEYHYIAFLISYSFFFFKLKNYDVITLFVMELLVFDESVMLYTMASYWL